MNDPGTALEAAPREEIKKTPAPVWKKEYSRRAVLVFSCVWIAAMLLPLIAMCFYAHPLHDDYPHVQSTAEAWASTGSLAQALQAAANRTASLYRTWQGTYAGMFLSAFTPMAFSASLYFIAPLCALLALALSAWYLTLSAVRALGHGAMQDALPVYAVFLTVWLGYLPGADEAIYWQSGAPYAYSAVALALLAGLLLRQHFRKPTVGRCIALAVCAALLGGLTYPLALGGCLALLLVTLWAFLRRSPAARSALLAFAFSAASLAVIVLAPGNAVRQARYGSPMSPMAAIVQSIAECLKTTGGWLSPQLVAAGLLLTALLWKPLKASGLPFHSPVLFSFFSFGALAAAFVPAIYATGLEGVRVDRIQATLYLFFVLVALGNLVYWLGWAANRQPDFHPTLSRWKVALCAVLAVWGLFACSIRTTPVAGSLISLASGEAARYSAEMTARENAVAQAQTPAEALATISDLSSHPYQFASDGLALGKNALVPIMHRYLAQQALLTQYPAGGIPQAEWEELDGWPSEIPTDNTENETRATP